jgi:hypothetical protein
MRSFTGIRWRTAQQLEQRFIAGGEHELGERQRIHVQELRAPDWERNFPQSEFQQRAATR